MDYCEANPVDIEDLITDSKPKSSCPSQSPIKPSHSISPSNSGPTQIPRETPDSDSFIPGQHICLFYTC